MVSGLGTSRTATLALMMLQWWSRGRLVARAWSPSLAFHHRALSYGVVGVAQDKARRVVFGNAEDPLQFYLKRTNIPTQRRTFTSLLMTTTDDDENTADETKSLESVWDISGLKKEVTRLILRSHKKIGKASQKLRKAKETVERLTSETSEASLEELEHCPDIDAIELEVQELQERLGGLNALEDALKTVKQKKSVLPEDMATLALDLGVDDKPPARAPRGPGRQKKGPRAENKKRKPYRRYYSDNNIEIRVGKKAEDNDELSLSPKHRDGSDWWMHASGCPGSHVVIRCSDQNPPEEVIQDAASLAARQSKCHGSVIKVSMTRCRDVKKPFGAKPGLVQLTGQVRTIAVNMKEAEKRLERLENTVLVN